LGRAAAAPVHPWRRRRPVTLAEPSAAGAHILAETLHQRGNSVVTNSCYGLFPTRAGV
jgi:hypothetical protein